MRGLARSGKHVCMHRVPLQLPSLSRTSTDLDADPDDRPMLAQVMGDDKRALADRFIRTGRENWLENRWLDLAEVVSDVGAVHMGPVAVPCTCDSPALR